MSNSDTRARRCESGRHGDRCERVPEEYVDYDTPRGAVETYVYCAEHADHYSAMASTSVLGRGRIRR